jgi:PAS domain S-box-containing protein
MGKKPTYKEVEAKAKKLQKEAGDLRLAEEVMFKSDEGFRRVADFTFDWEYWIAPDGEYVYVSPSCERITGYRPDEFRKDPRLLEAITHPEDRALVARHLGEELKSREALSLDFRIITRTGDERWISHMCQHMYDTDGGFLGRRGSNRDVTDRKQTETALRESEARYKGIVEHTINGVAVYRAVDEGQDFVFVDFNRAAERIEKIKREDVIGKSVCDVFPGVKDFGLLQVMRRVWESGKPEHHPVSIYEDQRISGWRENFVYKLPSGELVAVYSDETERKEAEQALRKAHEELYKFSQELEKMVQERTEELKDKSKQLVEAERLVTLGKIANRIAHDLRNPLTIIGGFARRMYEKTPEDDPNKRYLRIIVKEIMVLENRVSEIVESNE